MAIIFILFLICGVFCATFTIDANADTSNCASSGGTCTSFHSAFQISSDSNNMFNFVSGAFTLTNYYSLVDNSETLIGASSGDGTTILFNPSGYDTFAMSSSAVGFYNFSLNYGGSSMDDVIYTSSSGNVIIIQNCTVKKVAERFYSNYFILFVLF
jgi:hypothetical protein